MASLACGVPYFLPLEMHSKFRLTQEPFLQNKQKKCRIQWNSTIFLFFSFFFLMCFRCAIATLALISMFQVHLRKVMHRNRYMRKSIVIHAIVNRIWRDLIHNPLHLIFAVDVLGMTSSTLASLSKGFAELSTDGQFQQLRSKQVSHIFPGICWVLNTKIKKKIT